MKHTYILFLSFFLILFGGNELMWAQSLISQGGGQAPILEKKAPCLTPDQYAIEWAAMQVQRQKLIREGKLAERNPAARSVQNVSFIIPVRQAVNSPYTGYYGIVNYVDHDNSSNLNDWNCQQLTYDGHRGTDYSTWPFPWEMMDNNDVEVIAAETGVIISKFDGNFDKSCDWDNKPWNAVYVEHADGSIAWYGHLKKNTLTTKAQGDTLYKGDFVGFIGSSGISTGPHLHFEIFDANSKTIDPYDGVCNSSTSSSWWTSQGAHRIPNYLHHQTGWAAPNYGNFCYGQENPNQQDQFQPGDKIFLSAYLRDYLTSMTTTINLVAPDGSVFDTWNHSPSNSFALSYWWWSYQTANTMPQGVWEFEFVFDGQKYSAPFILGQATAIGELEGISINIGPNPVQDVLKIEAEGLERISYELLDMKGSLVKAGQLMGGSGNVEVSGLNKGIYLCRLSDEKKVNWISRKIQLQ